MYVYVYTLYKYISYRNPVVSLDWTPPNQPHISNTQPNPDRLPITMPAHPPN